MLTASSVNACKITNLSRHIPDRRYPVSHRARQALRDYYKSIPLTDMTINHYIIEDALRILSFIRDENDADEKLARIGEWFAKGGTKEATVYSRWASLLKACPPPTRLQDSLDGGVLSQAHEEE